MLVVMIGIRKSLDLLFTRRELKILDDVMPEMTKRANDDDLRQLEDGEVGLYRRFIACCMGDKPSSSVTTINVTKVVESKQNNSTTPNNTIVNNTSTCTTTNHATPTTNNVNHTHSS